MSERRIFFTAHAEARRRACAAVMECPDGWRVTVEPLVMLPALDGAGVDIVFRRTSAMTQREVSDLMAYIEAWEAETVP